MITRGNLYFLAKLLLHRCEFQRSGDTEVLDVIKIERANAENITIVVEEYKFYLFRYILFVFK